MVKVYRSKFGKVKGENDIESISGDESTSSDESNPNSDGGDESGGE